MVSQLPPPIEQLSASALSRLQAVPVSGINRAVFDVDHVERLYAWHKLERIPLLVNVGTTAILFDDVLATHRLRHLATGAAFSLLVLTLAAGFNRYDRMRRRSRETLEDSEQALRKLASHQTDLLEDERKFIAREIHDDLGQRLSVLRLDLSMAISGISSASAADLLVQGTQLKASIDDILHVTRELAKKVRPPSLEIGFLPAIEALCDEFQNRLPFTLRFVNHADNTFQPDDACAIAAYRILQESLTNASRYAQCQHIDISLSVHDDWLHLRVIDDGIGFDPTVHNTNRRTFGLLGMRERVAALHGEMRLQSQTGQGCKLLVMLPLNRTAANTRPQTVDK
jgi:signal transduction histidine kinase